MHALYAVLLAIWVGWEVLGFAGLGAWLFGRWPALPNGAYGLLAMAAPGFAWAYRKGSDKALALYVPLVAWWVVLQPFAWRFAMTPIYFMGAVGGLLLLAAEAHRPGSRMAVPYRVYGVLLTAGVLVPLSFYGFHKSVGSGPIDVWSSGLAQTLAIAALSAATLAAVVVVRRRRTPEPRAARWGPSLVDLARRQWLPIGIVAGMAGMAAGSVTGGDSPLPQTVAANAAMVALAFWLMRHRPARRPRIGLRRGGGLLRALGRPPLHRPLRRLRRHDRRGPDVLPLRGDPLRLVPLLASAEGGGPCVTPTAPPRARPEFAPSPAFAPEKPRAPLVNRALAWLDRHRRAVLVAGVVFQVLVLLSMVVTAAGPLVAPGGPHGAAPRRAGQPADLFRGDYVTLSYEVSRMPVAGALRRHVGSDGVT